MSNLQLFQYESHQVRTVDIDGEPWFVAADVCEVLGIAKHRDAISRLNDKQRGSVVMDTLGGPQEMAAINEAGLYRLAFTSRKKAAEKFTDWVASEVLPSIRKTGKYEVAQPKFKLPTYSETLRQLADSLDKNEEQEKQILELKPKAEFFDAVTGSEDVTDLGTVAKILNMGIGRNSLFDFLRESHILMENNRPYQNFVDSGFFRVIIQKYKKPDGSAHIGYKTVAFPKGIDFIRRRLEERGNGKGQLSFRGNNTAIAERAKEAA